MGERNSSRRRSGRSKRTVPLLSSLYSSGTGLRPFYRSIDPVAGIRRGMRSRWLEIMMIERGSGLPGSTRVSRSRAGSVLPTKREGECSTCKRRRYVCSTGDTSDGKVSQFDPSEARVRVWRHEREHLRIRRRQAKREGKEILRAGVQVSYSICPECGRRYPTGGRAFVKTREGKEDKHPKVSGDFDILA